jgi:HEAT repeat protein
MEIEKLINEIIPLNNYEHREGFNNEPILDKLTASEKRLVEDELIFLLLNKTSKDTDTLIVETLAYLKSEKSLPVLKSLLKDAVNEMTILIIATSIFEISGENEMVGVAISSFKKISQRKDRYYIYGLIATFYYLAKFKNPEINKIIKEYANHKEYLVSYNAKRFLNL